MKPVLFFCYIIEQEALEFAGNEEAITELHHIHSVDGIRELTKMAKKKLEPLGISFTIDKYTPDDEAMRQPNVFCYAAYIEDRYYNLRAFW